jgi:putative aldouronate transport system substrate-binding protein
MVTSDTYQLVSNNQAGLFFGTWWNPFTEIGNSWRNDNNANWQAYLLPSGPDGVTLAKAGNAAANFAVISKDAKNPEAVIKLLNIYKDVLPNYIDKDEQALMGEYPYPWSQTYQLADGPANLLKEFDNYIAGKKTVEEVHDYFNGFDPGAIPTFDKLVAFKTEQYNNNNISGWDFSGDKANDFGLIYSFGVGLRPYVEGKYKWVNNLTYERTETMEKRWGNLETLEFETFSKIVIGQEPISAFDTFVEQWKKEGGDKITQEIQESLGQ